MVLQREAKVPIWGWADPGEAITVMAGTAAAKATANADGKWTANLEGLKPSNQAIELTVTGKNTLTIHDVLVGDVWVCAGQSNMEFQLGGGKYGFGGTLNAAEEIPKADHPTIRFFHVPKKIAFDPQPDCEGSWKVCMPDTAARFSAVGYFFGREIQEDQHVPVGMIGSYWGGTPAEAWTSLDGLKSKSELAGYVKAFEDLKSNLSGLMKIYQERRLPQWQQAQDQAQKQWEEAAAKAKADGTPPPSKPKLARKPDAPDGNTSVPTVLSNGMIAPIVPLAIKGVIWYQGEANTMQPKLYQTLFPAMITDWRTRWAQGDFPFLWVQLAAYQSAPPADWPGLREAQEMTLKVPNTGQAITVDIGGGSDVHPKDKIDVGHRLALVARHVAYGETLVYSGPTYDSQKIEGDRIKITFKNVAAGLKIASPPSTQEGASAAEPPTELKGFTISGADHKFVAATAMIDGETVIVRSPDVREPQAVRYAWSDNPVVNLYSKEGLPASPFRTDEWDGPDNAGAK